MLRICADRASAGSAQSCAKIRSTNGGHSTTTRPLMYSTPEYFHPAADTFHRLILPVEPFCRMGEVNEIFYIRPQTKSPL